MAYLAVALFHATNLFLYPLKHQKISVFLMSSGRIERERSVAWNGLMPKSFFYFWFIDTAQKMKFSMKDFFSKCDKIRRKLWIWSHLLQKSFMENFIFCAVWFIDANLKYQIVSFSDLTYTRLTYTRLH